MFEEFERVLEAGFGMALPRGPPVEIVGIAANPESFAAGIVRAEEGRDVGQSQRGGQAAEHLPASDRIIHE